VPLGLSSLRSACSSFATALFELFPGLGADREVQTAVQKATKAADDFAALTKDAYRTGKVPRQSDPAAGALLDALFNVDVLKANTALAKADLSSLADWSAAQGKVGSIYIFSGTGISDPSRATSDPPCVNRSITTPPSTPKSWGATWTPSWLCKARCLP